MNKNKNIKKNTFSYYWVYVFLVVVISSYWMFGSFLNPGLKTISKSELVSYADNNQIERIEIVRETSTAEIYMSLDHVNQYSELNSRGPHYEYSIYNSESFEELLTEKNINYKPISRPDYIGPALSWIIPILIMIMIWIFIMRRMSRGGPEVKFLILGNLKHNFLIKKKMKKLLLMTLLV